MKPFKTAIAISLFSTLAACGGSTPEPEKSPAPRNNEPVAQAPENASAPTEPTREEPVAQAFVESSGPTGLANCDRFLARYQACLDTVPKDVRAGLQSALDAWRENWTKSTRLPGISAQINANCQRTADNAWAAVAQYNCAH